MGQDSKVTGGEITLSMLQDAYAATLIPVPVSPERLPADYFDCAENLLTRALANQGRPKDIAAWAEKVASEVGMLND